MGFAPPSQYSPPPGAMSDNNTYETPVISPGSWNAPTPESQITAPYDSPSSVQSRSSSSAMPHAPTSASSASMDDYPSLPSELGKVEVIKSDVDMERESMAENRALRLMDRAVGAKPQVRSSTAGALTARQAATKRDEMQKKIETESKIRHKEEREKMKPTPKLAIAKPKERLATSTRKVKQSPEDDSAAVFEEETVDDMKCQLDREREQEAEKKALRLLQLTDLLHLTDRLA
jgi:hypothetical protein